MCWLWGYLVLAGINIAAASVPLSPTAMAASADGKSLYVACATANHVLRFDVVNQKVTALMDMPEPPSGLALSADGRRLYVTCAAPESQVCIVNTAKQKIITTIHAGHTAMSPVLSPDGKTLYVCNRFNNNVSVIDLAAKKEVRRIAVQREPVAAAITKDGRYLLVANQLPVGRADVNYVAAVVSVIDLKAGKVVKEIHLPNGSTDLKDICISPNGQYAIVTHTIGNFEAATFQVQDGWINVNAMTIIDLRRMEPVRTLLLDSRNRGAGNPWGIAWSADGATVVITHAGTQEVNIIDFPALMAGLTTDPASVITDLGREPGVDDGLYLLTADRERIPLPQGDLGPRSAVIIGPKAYIANYYSDTLSVIDLRHPHEKAESVPLGPRQKMGLVRKGNFYFHDADLCKGGWQSCSSCHPGDARSDGLDWDLLNDGVGNPKNVKSLLFAYKTPPVMWLGERANVNAAVHAGIKYILFTKQPESVAAAIVAYLKSLKPVPSPYLVDGKLSKAAERGRRIFFQAGCATCHTPPLYTDLFHHDVGTLGPFDTPGDKFYTPTLIEAWRTAPYLHDGSAATIRDVLTTRNPHDEHGETSKLSRQQIDDLCAYVLSL